MRSALSLLIPLALAAPVFAQPKPPDLPPHLMAPTGPLSPADERKQFTVPPGFDVQLVASEPDIQKPMQMAFDAKGRLWVTSSYHYPFPPDSAKATDKLFILSDFDPATGKAKKVQTFASDLNIPIGILPLPDCNSCIVSSVGEIRKYTDTDGDGKADKHEVLFSGFGFRDTHGMYNSYTLMPDGWVYACHGFNNDSKVKGKDGHEVVMQSGNTFRFKPDGSRLEAWTRGQVNPFGMAVDPWFNLYTADCHSKPITQLIPGAYYESFGKPHDGLGYTPHVTAHPHKSTGLCGLVWYDADHFPKEYVGRMLIGDVVSNCISADKIHWKGSTPVAEELPDFLTSTDRWFRPVDIKLGPDGALYVADFYNKIIGHYEVDLKDPRRDKDRGRIWRIVWKGADGKAPAPKFHRDDFTKATDADLFDDVLHPNLTVRLVAGHQLRRRAAEGKFPKQGDGFWPKLEEAEGRVESVLGWVLSAGESEKPLPANAYERFAAFAKNGEIGLKPEHLSGHVLRVMAGRPSWGAGERAVLLDVLKAFDSVRVRRAAVEAVILHPHAEFVKPLVEVLAKCPAEDVMLKQAAKIALRNCLRDDPNAWPPYKDMEALRKGFDPIYAEVALAIPSRTPAEYLLSQLQEGKLPAGRLAASAEHIARHGERRDWMLAIAHFTSRDPSEFDESAADAILAVFRGLQASGKQLSVFEADGVLKLVQAQLDRGDGSGPAEVRRLTAAVRVLGGVQAATKDWAAAAPPAGLVKALAAWAERESAAPDVRAVAADGLLRLSPGQALPVLRKMLDDRKVPAGVRERVLVALAQSGSRDAQLDARDALKDAPYRTAVQVGLGLAGTREGADVLLAAVKQGKAPQRLLQEKAILERLKASNVPNWEKQVAELTRSLPPADQRIGDLIKQRANAFASVKADPAEGAKVFAKNCAACHKIGDAGGKIAPQLDGIGVRGAERLLEDVLDPNRNVDQAFRARSITTTDDRTITALMLRVEGEVLVVADLEGKEKRIPTKDIVQNRETMLSAMPANFADVIPEAEFYHLLAYLLSQKTAEKK